jgi:shikimate kinase
MRIVIVGPCAAGKTTLANELSSLGWDAHDCAQEHSNVQTMWQRISRPDILIYLGAQAPAIRARLQVDWEQAYVNEMERRLTHARQHADFVLETDSLSIPEVLERVLAFLGTASASGKPLKSA